MGSEPKAKAEQGRGPGKKKVHALHFAAICLHSCHAHSSILTHAAFAKHTGRSPQYSCAVKRLKHPDEKGAAVTSGAHVCRRSLGA